MEKHDLSVDFVECTYKGEEIDSFCIHYREAVNRCVVVSIKIEELIQVMQFLHVVDSHFDQWTTIKRAKMCRGTELPSLHSLLHEIKDEYRRKKEQASLHVNSILHLNPLHGAQSSDSSVLRCSNCGLTCHTEVHCFYKHAHLRRPGWQPNPLIL